MILSRIWLMFIGLSISLSFTTAFATTIQIINNDGAGEGLNDPTSVSAVPGNSATTLGAQYLNVFQAAADYWEDRLDSNVNIRATAQLDLLTCTASSAVLGSAGPTNAFRNFLNAPLPNTFYTVAQANSLAGFDLDGANDDISMRFNNGIGNVNCLSGLSWWLGIDSPAPSGTISFYDTILHELAHGLGFLTFVNQSGSKLSGRDDTYMVNLFDRSFNKSWPDMSNAERAVSSINTGNLIWSGEQVTQNSSYLASGKRGNNVRLYAPNPYRQGSSVSHWDTVLAPDELMEPSATLTSNDCATTSAFKDMGWNTKGGPGEFGFTRVAKVGYETEGSVSISVERFFDCGRTPQGAVSVMVNTSDGSAFSGSDYSLVNQTLSWASGETGTKTISISIFDDGLEEDAETFTLNLSNPTGGAALASMDTATITINDELSDETCFPIKSASGGGIAVICF